MMRRNGGLGKVIAGIILFFGAVYVIYLYNDLSGQLKNTERTAERYRREQESVSAQLQVQYGHVGRLDKALQTEKLKYKASLDDLTVAKNEMKQRCDNDQQEMTNRLNSLNQQHKMLKSQHDDMESDFGRLQSEHERETEEHKKLDDERSLEYNQFKQEKILEISNLKDTVANLEREKEQLTEDITKLKTQLHNSLSQANQDKQTISQLQQSLQQHKVQIRQDHKFIRKLESRLEEAELQIQSDAGAIQEYQARLTQAQNLVQQAQQQQQQQQNLPQQQQGLQHNLNQQLGQQQPQHGIQQQQQQQQPGAGFIGGAGLGQGQNVQQMGLKLQQPVGGAGQQKGGFLQPADGNQQQQQQQQQGQDQVKLPHEEGMNMAEEILQSLKDKHRPVDADEVEEQQKQHQILPPMDHGKDPKEKDGKNLGERDHVVEGAEEDDHDNRLENQGPIGLQVQEPKMKQSEDKDFGRQNLLFRPKVPDVIDNQIQPHLPVDDSLKEEQIDKVPVKDMHLGDHLNQIDGDDNLEHDEDEDDDDNYDDDAYDKENDNDKEDDDY